MAKKLKINVPEFPKVYETFTKPWSNQFHIKNDPSCFNSEVAIEKYKITVELIPEDKEVYRERLQKLWDECDNYHHVEPLKRTAERLGIELIGSYGTKRRK